MESDISKNIPSDTENQEKHFHENFIKMGENYNTFIGFLFAANGVVILGLISFLQLIFDKGIIELNSILLKIELLGVVFTLVASFMSILDCILFFNQSNQIPFNLRYTIENFKIARKDLEHGIMWFAASLFSMLLIIGIFIITHIKF